MLACPCAQVPAPVVFWTVFLRTDSPLVSAKSWLHTFKPCCASAAAKACNKGLAACLQAIVCMSPCHIHVEVSAEPLSLQALADRVQADSAGAIATFSGVTRNNFDGRPVLYLVYEAYTPMAEKKLQV